jgi:hypothetical protein
MSSIKLKGDTSGEITIQAPSVAGTNTLNLQASSGTLATTAQASIGTKNLIINGNMQIAQRGTSATGINTSGYYTVDRISTSYANPSGVWTQTQDTDVPTGQGFSNSLKMQCTTASAVGTNERLALAYRFEGQMLQHIKKGTASAESLTLSFWVKSNKTGTYIANLYDVDNTRSISKTYTISSANTWEKKIITFAGDTSGALDNDNNQSLMLFFGLAVGTFETSGTLQTSWGSNVATNRFVGQVDLQDSTSNYINITGVQLEVGTEATPFENKMYSTELAMCQRYYYRLYDTATTSNGRMIGTAFMWSTTAIRTFVTFPVTMRDLPSVESSNFTNAFSAYIASVAKYLPSLDVAFSGAESTRGCLISGTITVAGTSGDAGYIRFDSTSGASLAFTAEL